MYEELFEGLIELVGCVDKTEKPFETELNDIIASLPRCKGVIFFADEEGRAIQLLSSANIRRAAEGRLKRAEEDERSKKADISGIVAKIYYRCCYNNLATTCSFYECAKAIYPDNYDELVKVPRRYYINIDINDKWPNFDVSDKAAGSGSVSSFGPFVSRKSADDYIDMVRQVFGLCRRPELVDFPSRSASCPYVQIGNCGAPCQGRLEYDEYLERLKQAATFAGGEKEGVKDKLDARMRELAGELKFEDAQQVKESLKKLGKLEARKYKWVGDMSDFAVVHIDKAGRVEPIYKEGKRKHKGYEAFVIRADGVWRSGRFAVFQSARVIKDIREKLSRPLSWKEAAKSETNEMFAVATKELMKKGKMGLWLDREGFGKVRCFEDFIAGNFK